MLDPYNATRRASNGREGRKRVLGRGQLAEVVVGAKECKRPHFPFLATAGNCLKGYRDRLLGAGAGRFRREIRELVKNIDVYDDEYVCRQDY